MKRKEQTIVEKEIPGREHAGYAYIYPLDGGARQEYVLEMTPENIANFIGAHQYDAEKLNPGEPKISLRFRHDQLNQKIGFLRDTAHGKFFSS